MLVNLALSKDRVGSASRFAWLLGEILKRVQDDKSEKFQIFLVRFMLLFR